MQIFTRVQVAYHERIQAQCQEVAGSPYIVPSTSLTCTHMTKRRPHLRLAPVKVRSYLEYLQFICNDIYNI